MPSRPMFDWHGPLCQLLMINEDSSIDEDAAAKLELAESIEETLMYAQLFHGTHGNGGFRKSHLIRLLSDLQNWCDTN